MPPKDKTVHTRSWSRFISAKFNFVIATITQRVTCIVTITATIRHSSTESITSSCRIETLVFFLNVFTEFSDTNICRYRKRARTCHTATSCVRDQHATPAPARHMWETVSLNQAQLMLHWLPISLNSLNSVKVLLHLGKTPFIYIYFPKKNTTDFNLIRWVRKYRLFPIIWSDHKYERVLRHFCCQNRPRL